MIQPPERRVFSNCFCSHSLMRNFSPHRITALNTKGDSVWTKTYGRINPLLPRTYNAWKPTFYDNKGDRRWSTMAKAFSNFEVSWATACRLPSNGDRLAAHG